ncbi:hypothetical protein B0H14DRAFT_2851570 [Mycena olivaceomarginata]|nr:hypothetical protein B0H14DRAFT_2851570 [Mycena olivaceomarginata]
MKLRIPRLLPRQILSLPFICGHTCNISTASYSTPSQNPGSADTSPYRPSCRPPRRRRRGTAPCPPGGAGGVPPRGPPRGPVVRSAGGAAGCASAAAREARGEDR